MLASFVVALLIQAVPADSAKPSDTAWYRQAPLVDARLVPDIPVPDVVRAGAGFGADTQPRPRRHAVSYSDAYYTRLQIHRYASWLELPVFASEYWLGQKLINDSPRADWVKGAHGAVAATLGGLFAVNTITGAWNLWESRSSTDDRGLVWTHSALMLASDAGFAITGLLAGDADERLSKQNQHKNAALTSMGIATAGTLLMWVKRGF